jgi:hypothetical protein
MNPKNRRRLADRVAKAAEAALAAHVSCVDVLLGIGWLDPNSTRRWQRGQIECLESAIQTRPERIAEAMELLWSWATGKGLIASETADVARRPRRQTLRFSRSGDPTIEQQYRTHWMSPELSKQKHERCGQTPT